MNDLGRSTSLQAGMRFPETFCSQCGAAFGPGDHGYSHCDQHPGYKRDRMLRRKAAARRGWETRHEADLGELQR
jgi:hypothetical protein